MYYPGVVMDDVKTKQTFVGIRTPLTEKRSISMLLQIQCLLSVYWEGNRDPRRIFLSMGSRPFRHAYMKRWIKSKREQLRAADREGFYGQMMTH